MFENFFERFYTIFISNKGYKLMLDGLKGTLLIAVVALVIGVVVGTIVAVVKVVPKNRFVGFILDPIVNVYITVIRGTPVTVQLLLAYFVLLKGINSTLVAIIVFGINSSAYVAEIVRSGIMSVDKGQMEAGRSLGLNYRSTMWKIILPQAIKNILPALGNELIVLIKETSVAGLIAIFEVTRAARAIVSSTYDAFVPYLALAAVYLAVVLIATFFVDLLERRLRRSDNG